MIRALLILLCLSLPAAAEEVVADLSQNRVSITANFDGSEILLFGAVKREAPIPMDSDLNVIVTIEGPSTPVTVRKKSRVAGIWVNTDAIEIATAPSFYAIASTDPLDDILMLADDLRHRITIPRAIRAIGVSEQTDRLREFTQALIRIRSGSGLYQSLEGQVDLTSDTLFRTQVALPANLVEGPYKTRVFLTRNGAVIDQYETQITVTKVGLERFLYRLAHDRPLIYGLLSLFIAIVAGWGASAAFRAIRG